MTSTHAATPTAPRTGLKARRRAAHMRAHAARVARETAAPTPAEVAPMTETVPTVAAAPRSRAARRKERQALKVAAAAAQVAATVPTLKGETVLKLRPHAPHAGDAAVTAAVASRTMPGKAAPRASAPAVAERVTLSRNVQGNNARHTVTTVSELNGHTITRERINGKQRRVTHTVNGQTVWDGERSNAATNATAALAAKVARNGERRAELLKAKAALSQDKAGNAAKLAKIDEELAALKVEYTAIRDLAAVKGHALKGAR